MRFRYEETSPQNKRQYVIAVGVHELRALLGAVQVAVRNAPDITFEENQRLTALRSSKRGLAQAIKYAESIEDDGKRLPYEGTPRDNSNDSKGIVKYGAVGEEGCEYMADTKEEVQKWIDTEVAGEGHSDEPVPDDYYSIYAYTQKELDEMIEV